MALQTDASHTVQVHLSSAALDRATRLAEQQGLSVSGLLDETLDEVLAIKERLFTRRALTTEESKEFLRVLDKPRGEPLPGDELPPGYERIKY